MQNSLKTLRQCLILIQEAMPEADAKFTMRAALLLVFLLEYPEPASYVTIKQFTGIEQNKASDMATKLISYGAIWKTQDRAGYTAFSPTERGLRLRDSLLNKLGGSTNESDQRDMAV